MPTVPANYIFSSFMESLVIFYFYIILSINYSLIISLIRNGVKLHRKADYKYAYLSR